MTANQKVPLWQLEGQTFFTKELDEALNKKAVDLVIHSYKDLGSQRPLRRLLLLRKETLDDILLVKKELVKNWSNLPNLLKLEPALLDACTI